MPGVKNALKLICKNTACINKSVVYRKQWRDDLVCKLCNQPLSKVVDSRNFRSDEKAKRELKELGG